MDGIVSQPSSAPMLLLQGCDRKFVDTLLQFENMDILINYINQRSSMFGVSVEYATLKEYFGILRGLRVNWKVRGHRDFLPYSSGRKL